MERTGLTWLQGVGGDPLGAPWLEVTATVSGMVVLAWAVAVFLFARRRPKVIAQGAPLYGLALLLMLGGGGLLVESLTVGRPPEPLEEGIRAAIAVVGGLGLGGMIRLVKGLDQAPSLDWLTAENRALRRESDSYRQQLEGLKKEHGDLALKHDEQRWEVERLQREVAAREAQLAQERIRDEATGLFTRDHFLQRMREEFERALRRGCMPAPLFLGLQGLEDLDPQQQARILHETGQVLVKCMRQPDIATRFSEHELVVVPVDTDQQGGTALARRVHREVVRAFHGENPVGVTFALMDYDVTFQEYPDFIAACDHVRSQLTRQDPGKLVRYSASAVSRALSH